nr:pentapeptide repeat-containing protein [Phytohabitans rumicis]
MTLDTLRADCARCFGLCCVVPAFSASADFAIDKPAGHACPNLQQDFRCGIHDRLRDRGFPGCTVYDCFGAGQKVAQVTFGGRPELGESMFAAYRVMRQLHELLWYLTQGLALPAARPLHADLGRLRDETERRTHGGPDELATVDTDPLWRDVNALLVRASELARAGLRGPERRGADLIGKDLRRVRLRGANLRGAYLIGADLRGVDLTAADLIGADLRGANLAGADLSASLFLTQPQVTAARGTQATHLPPPLSHPPHWP